MPCRNDFYESDESIMHKKRMIEDPIYAKEYLTKEFESNEKWKKENIKRIEEEEKQYNKELKEKNLEKLAFGSFMTVFLCKALDIATTNYGEKYIDKDLLWWYKEHQYRDQNNDSTLLTDEELAKKLLEINKKYFVK